MNAGVLSISCAFVAAITSSALALPLDSAFSLTWARSVVRPKLCGLTMLVCMRHSPVATKSGSVFNSTYNWVQRSCSAFSPGSLGRSPQPRRTDLCLSNV